MKNKIIFAAAVIGVFLLSALIGWHGPQWMQEFRAARIKAAFSQPSIPEDALRNFQRDFNAVQVATEPQAFPDDVFLSASSTETRISDFAGKPTLVNLWATWCAPCVVELPTLEKLRTHYKDRLNVIAIAIEDPRTPAQIQEFLEKREAQGLGGYVGQSGEFSKKLELRGIPTSFLIGRDGQILYRFEGDADWASDDSRHFFDSFLQGGK